MQHHAIVVTTYDEATIIEARAKAVEIGCAVSEIVNSPINGYRSFFVAPDGSKLGWVESDRGDAQRDQFVAWIRAEAFGDGSSYLDWAEVKYGDDDDVASLVRAGDEILTTGGEDE
jgi:hypothetical protein